jgi:hypothetical protein
MLRSGHGSRRPEISSNEHSRTRRRCESFGVYTLPDRADHIVGRNRPRHRALVYARRDATRKRGASSIAEKNRDSSVDANPTEVDVD